MLVKRLKISYKIVSIVLAGIIISSTFAAWSIFFGNKQISTLENIYVGNVTPLDNLRKIQLIFRELEFRMTGVQADVIAPIGSAPHLEQSLKDAEAAWEVVSNSLKKRDLSEDAKNAIKTYEKGYKGFKEQIAGELIKVYLNEDLDGVADIYDEWLDFKPLIFKSIDKFADILRGKVEAQYLESQETISNTNTYIMLIAFSCIAMFIVFAFLMVRSIKKPIDKVVEFAEQIAEGDLTLNIQVETEDEMGNMAGKLNVMINNIRTAFSKIVNSVETMSSDTEGLSDLSARLLKGAEEQRTKGDQITAASDEMSRAILDMAQNTTDSSNATKESLDTAKSGKEIVGRTVGSITNLAGSVEEASNKIAGLGESVNEIGEIVSAIKDIADQTNLLALNAAIEAARSGEHGRGFAVVADEVKKLAERTAKATEEIDEKIHGIQTKSDESILTMEKGKALAEESVSNATEAGEALQRIVDSSDMVMDMVRKVTAATEEQSSASEEVGRTMEGISNIINEHFGMAEEMEKSASRLADLARGVIEQTAYFRTEEKNDHYLEAEKRSNIKALKEMDC